MPSNVYDEIQNIIGTDAGGRGMKSLIVPGDLELAGKTLGTMESPSHVAVLSGFPCCVANVPSLLCDSRSCVSPPSSRGSLLLFLVLLRCSSKLGRGPDR